MRVIFVILFLVSVNGCSVYETMDAEYQKAHDPIRISHANKIASLVKEYKDKTGYYPIPEELVGTDDPFMVFIGRSIRQEDKFSQIPALRGGGIFVNSGLLEGELSRVLGKKIVLPRDPQKVTSFAPNIYVYYTSKDLTCVYAHLYRPTNLSKQYKWEGGTFYSHPVCPSVPSYTKPSLTQDFK